MFGFVLYHCNGTSGKKKKKTHTNTNAGLFMTDRVKHHKKISYFNKTLPAYIYFFLAMFNLTVKADRFKPLWLTKRKHS